MEYYEFYGKYEDGLYCGNCALKYDIAQERIHRRMMRLHHLAGNHAAALRQFDRCVAALDEELGVRPAKRTQIIFEQILADHPDYPSQANEADTTRAPATLVAIDELSGQRGQFWSVPSSTLNQLETELLNIKRTLFDLHRSIVSLAREKDQIGTRRF